MECNCNWNVKNKLNCAFAQETFGYFLKHMYSINATNIFKMKTFLLVYRRIIGVNDNNALTNLK